MKQNDIDKMVCVRQMKLVEENQLLKKENEIWKNLTISNERILFRKKKTSVSSSVYLIFKFYDTEKSKWINKV